jgi:hypothetical protein
MANFSANVALGREVEFHNNVDNNNPANSALIVMVLAALNLVGDSTLQDYDTFADLLAGASNEVTNGGYARKTLTDANLTAYTVDDTLNQIVLPLADQTFSTILAGDSWAKLVIGYDNDTTGGTDANIVPVKYYDVRSPVTNAAVVPTGDDIIFSFPSGYHIASAS